MKISAIGLCLFFLLLSGCAEPTFEFASEEIAILSPQISEITDNSALFTFATSKKGTTEIYYKRLSSVEKIYVDTEEVLDHSVRLDQLVPQEEYFCRIITRNEDGNFCEIDDLTFVTDPYPLVYPEN